MDEVTARDCPSPSDFDARSVTLGVRDAVRVGGRCIWTTANATVSARMLKVADAKARRSVHGARFMNCFRPCQSLFSRRFFIGFAILLALINPKLPETDSRLEL